MSRLLSATGRCLLVAILAAAAAAAWPLGAKAHDLRLALEDLERGTQDVALALARLRARPPIPRAPATPDEHRRLLGEAEIDFAVGYRARALSKLLGRLADPAFKDFPEYTSTLLLASQILEETDEPIGAMIFARQALDRGGNKAEMAEAGARWFRMARLHDRYHDREAILALWRDRGGFGAAGIDNAAEAAYEAAFALRKAGKSQDAQALLGVIPAESRVGSRAAYLSGVIFVERGDLANAERWFAAVMGWPVPASLDDGGPQRRVEVEVRELAALAAARLRYERGDLAAADEAYGHIGDDSTHRADACYEQAFLALERHRRLGALIHLQCVTDLGAKGARAIDVRLTRASLLAHLDRYSESVELYEYFEQSLAKEASLVREALAGHGRPAELLFQAMERNAVDEGQGASPGPAALFGDSWTPAVDAAYRLDRAVGLAQEALVSLRQEIAQIRSSLDRVDAFAPLESRRQLLRQIIRDIQHLEGHSSDLLLSSHAYRADATDGFTEHEVERAKASSLLVELDGHAKAAEAQLTSIDEEERSRRAQAEVGLAAVEKDLEGLEEVAAMLAGEVRGVADDVSREALAVLVRRFEDAVMRARAGVLDTFWLKKEEMSHRIRALAQQKEELKESFEAAAEASRQLD